MSKKILLKTKGENNKIRFAVTDNNELVFQGVYSEDFLYCDNICSVRVKDRVPAQKSVFCDAGQDRTAFIGDCNFMPGKMLLVQALSSEHDSKGVKFSTNIRIRGKYFILLIHQYSSKSGIEAKISKKITDLDFKRKLADFIAEYPARKGFESDFYIEVICRTSVADVDDFSVLDADLDSAFAEWDSLLKDFSDNYKTNAKIGVLKGFADVIDYICKHERSDDFDEIVTDCPVLSHNLSESSPMFANKIKCMSEKNEFDIFAVYSVDNKLSQLLRKKVNLKSGAFLVVEFTEAMTVIDVNSGKNTVDSAFEINIEAANEIMRQLRLRDLGGIIVCDFINMPDRRLAINLVEHMRTFIDADPCDLYISDVSRLGLVEIARKRN